MLENIRQLYQNYLDEFQHLEKTRRAGAGMFGMSNGPRNYPCHERFGQDLKQLLQKSESVPPEEAAQVLDHIYFSPKIRQENQDAVYWMLTAVHGMTEPLVERLTSEDAAALLERYQAAYPRRELLPAQKKVISALKKRAKRIV